MSVISSGLFGPTLDDVVRLVILVLCVVDVLVLLVVVRTLRNHARLLLDMEQFVREARQASRRLVEKRAADRS